jgi:hypothetical protein
MASHDRRTGLRHDGVDRASVVERDIARIHVEQEHAVPFEGAEDRLDFRPARAELFHGGSAAFGLVFRGEYDTMDASPEWFTHHQALAVGVLPDPANQVGSIHGRWIPDGSRSFCPCAHGAAPQRLGIGHLPSRSRLSDLDRTDRSPSGASRDRHVCGRPRKSLGGPVTRRLVSHLAADERLALLGLRWVHGWITVVVPANQAGSMPGRRLPPSFLPDPPCNGATVGDRGDVGVRCTDPSKDNSSMGPRSTTVVMARRVEGIVPPISLRVNLLYYVG